MHVPSCLAATERAASLGAFPVLLFYFVFPLEFKNPLLQCLGKQLRRGPLRLKPTLDVSSLSSGKGTQDSTVSP